MKLHQFKYFYPEKPKLLVRGQALFDKLSHDPMWIAEPKYNGSRLQLHHINGVTHFWARNGQELVYTPSKDMEEALKQLPPRGYFLFDGELRHNKTKGVQDKVVLWDAFIYNGKLQFDLPYWVRRQKVIDIGLEQSDLATISLIKQYKGDFKKLFEKLIQFKEFEGLVLKNTQGKLKPGVNSCPDSRWMFKIRKETGRHRY